MKCRNSLFVFVLTVALAIAGCNRKTIYSHYEHTPIYGWEKTDHLSFVVSPVTDNGTFREEVGLRINGAYPFMGLTLIVEQQVYPSGMRRSDTLSCKLVDADGTVQGEGVSFYQYRFHLCNMRLAQGDSLRVSIRHNMKREILPGIADVGVTLTKIN